MHIHGSRLVGNGRHIIVGRKYIGKKDIFPFENVAVRSAPLGKFGLKCSPVMAVSGVPLRYPRGWKEMEKERLLHWNTAMSSVPSNATTSLDDVGSHATHASVPPNSFSVSGPSLFDSTAYGAKSMTETSSPMTWLLSPEQLMIYNLHSPFTVNAK